LYEKEQADLGRAYTLQSMGDLASRLGQVAEAQTHYQQALGLFEKEQDDLGRANTLQSLGDLARRLGQVGEAQAHYQQALDLYEKQQDDLGLGNTWAGLACLWQAEQKNSAQAADAAQKALHHARLTGLPPTLEYVETILKEAGFALATLAAPAPPKDG
jgi:tetratricopeptide (TPR) repeat protein